MRNIRRSFESAARSLILLLIGCCQPALSVLPDLIIGPKRVSDAMPFAISALSPCADWVGVTRIARRQVALDREAQWSALLSPQWISVPGPRWGDAPHQARYDMLLMDEQHSGALEQEAKQWLAARETFANDALLEAMLQIARDHPQFFDAVRRQLFGDWRPELERISGLELKMELTRSDIETWIRYLRHEVPEVADQAREALRRSAATAAKSLIRAVADHPGFPNRRFFLEMIMESTDASTAEILERASRNGTPGERITALQLLARTPNEKLFKILCEYLDNDPNDEDKSIAEMAAKLLVSYGPPAQEPLLASLRSFDSRRRGPASRALHRLHYPEVASVMLSALNDSLLGNAAFYFLAECPLYEALTKEHLIFLIDGLHTEVADRLLEWIIEPLYFRHEAWFDEPTIKKLEVRLPNSVAVRQLRQYQFLRTNKDPKTPAKELAHSLLSKSTSRILIVHNIRDGRGDELIRNAALISALLGYNKLLEIDVYTDRPDLYDDPRIHVHPFESFSEAMVSNYDMAVLSHEPRMPVSAEVQERVEAYATHNSIPLIIRVSKPNGINEFDVKIVADDLARQIPSHAGWNVYIPFYRALAELGIPFRYGVDGARAAPFNGSFDLESERWWQETVTAANAEGRPVAIVNGVGGEEERKGFLLSDDLPEMPPWRDIDREGRPRRPEEERKLLSTVVENLVEQGFFVIALPNHQPWGSSEILLRSLQLSEEALRRCVIAPSLSGDERPSLARLLIHRAAQVVTVEGGLMHLAYAMGKPFRLLVTSGAGWLFKWFPAGADARQFALNGYDVSEPRLLPKETRHLSSIEERAA